MNKNTNLHEEVCDQNRRGLTAGSLHPSSILHSLSEEPLLWPQCTDKLIENGGCSNEAQPNKHPSFDVFEELFCSSLPSAGLAPLALRTHPGPHSDVLKRGYLGKQEHKHRKYFVLRAGSHSGPSRLEWYRNEDSFMAVEKSAVETGIFSVHKQGVIFLRCCLGVSLMSCPRKDYNVALYAKDQTLVVVGKDQQDQHEWYTAIKKLMEEELTDGNREGFDEEDAGYCTLPPASFYKQVWPVTVKPRGLGRSRSLAGEVLLCLTASALVLVRVGHDLDLPSVMLPLLTVRRFGHLDGTFFLELGRSAQHGPGEIWMEPRDNGSSAVAQQIHEAVREVVRALRVIPDFGWSGSPSKNCSSHSQGLIALKRSRPKQREKPIHCRADGSPPHLQSQIQSDSTKLTKETQNPESVSLSPLGTELCSALEADCYMEMKIDHSPVKERRSEGREYMLMSPGATHGLQDEYVAMTSPQKHDLTKRVSFSFLQSSFSSGSDDHSPQNITEQTPPPWTLYSGQSNSRAVNTWVTSSPVSRAGALRPVSFFSRRSPTEPARPDTEDAPEQSVRSCLLSCLPSCLQPKTNG